MTQTIIGPHNADNIYSESGRQALRAYNLELRPRWMNLLRASQEKEALQCAEELHQDTPQGRYLIRTHFGPLATGDERTLELFPNPDAYFETILTPYRDKPWLVPVVGNEITMPNYAEVWMPWHQRIVALAKAENVALGIGRFPTGHPHHYPYDPNEQFDQFDRTMPGLRDGLGDLFAQYNNLVYTPNLYYTPTDHSMIEKGLEFIEYIGYPETVIGELGVLKTPSSATDGFLSLGWTQIQAADDIIDTTKQYFLSLGICVLYFVRGKWWKSPKFETDSAFETQLVKRRKEFLMADPPIYPGFHAEVTAVPSLRLRASPSTGAGTIAALPTGTLITMDEPDSSKALIGTETWLQAKIGSDRGWVYAAYLRLPASEPTSIPIEEHNAIVSGYLDRIAGIKDLAKSILDA